MIQTEGREIDRAVALCKLIRSDLLSCVGIVKRLDRKYNEPNRIRAETRLFFADKAEKSSTPTLSSFVSSKRSMSLSSASLASSGGGGKTEDRCGKMQGRSSHELNAIFVDLKSKCIRLRRELEATTAQAQRLTESSLRQDRVQHRMLWNAHSSETFICNHWGNNIGPKRNYTKSWRLKDYIEMPTVRKATIQRSF